jgi:hypothetical protein
VHLVTVELTLIRWRIDRNDAVPNRPQHELSGPVATRFFENSLSVRGNGAPHVA